MPFVKLDCGLLDSTLWIDTVARDVFITALLMAEPTELKEPMGQLNVRDLNDTGFYVPCGWYGFVPAAGTGIIHRSGVPLEQGLKALEILGSEDPESRTPDFGGRRMVRINGGYLILNFIKYREKDATSADRSKRWRERQKLKALNEATRVTDTPTPVIRHQAEAEAEGKKKRTVALRAPELPSCVEEDQDDPFNVQTKEGVKPLVIKDRLLTPEKLFMELWRSAFLETFETAYKDGGIKEVQALKRLLKTGEPCEVLMDIAKKAWLKPEGYWSKRAITITGLESNFMEIRKEIGDLKPKLQVSEVLAPGVVMSTKSSWGTPT